MNTMFGEWYRAVQLEPKAAELELRWQGVEKLKASTDTGFIEQLVKLHLALPDVSGEFMSSFRTTFFEIDSTFRMTGNDIELQVLAGAVLDATLDRKDVFSDGVALTLIASAAPDLRKKIFLQDVLTKASDHLFDRGSLVRSVQLKSKINMAGFDASITEIKTAATTNPVTLGVPLEAAFRVVADNFSKLNQNIDGRLTSIQRRQDVLAEESNIVWWLFGAARRDTLVTFAQENAVQAAFCAARDLADLTIIVPPPLAASAYLSRILSAHASEKFALSGLSDAIQFATPLKSSGLFPLTSFLLAVTHGKSAKEAATLITKLFALNSSALSVEAISKQFYREILAHRFLNK